MEGGNDNPVGIPTTDLRKKAGAVAASDSAETASPTANAPDASAALRKSARPGSVRPGGAKSLLGSMVSGRYLIEKLLGEGGMGAVYQAEHTLMRKRVALKVLHPEMTRMPEVVARFEREAMAAGSIEHPNVAAATDFGKLDDGSFFLVLEFIEGHSLRDYIVQGRFPLGRVLHVARQLASALSRAHALGIVHRDLKPENVMILERDGDSNFVKILDFGIAKVPMGEMEDRAAGVGETSFRSSEGAPPVLTQLGMIYGTPEYMAPEQALGQPVDSRADLYSVGVMMFEMIVGHRPFDAESKVKLLGMHVTAPVPTLAEVAPELSVPAEIEAILQKLMSKEASDRYQDARELVNAIDGATATCAARGEIEVFSAPPASRLLTSVGSGNLPSDNPNVARTAHAPTLPALSSTGADPMLAPLLVRARSWAARSVAAAKQQPRVAAVFIVATLFGVVVVGGLVVSVVGGKKSTPGGLAAATSEGQGAAGASSSDSDTRPPEERLREAIQMVERGDHASGIDRIKALPVELRQKPEALRALITAENALTRHRDATTDAQIWLGLDPKSADERALRIAVRDAAISTDKEASDVAFGLLETRMGTQGLDDTYDVAYGASGMYSQPAQKRARAILKKPELREKMSPALSITIDVSENLSSCNLRKYLERAGTDGDRRTAETLKRVPPAPSGVFRRDSLRCLRDGSVQRAIQAIEGRVK